MTTNVFDTAAILIVLAALFAYANHRFLRLPSTIGLLLSGLAASIGVLVLDGVFPGLGLGRSVRETISSIHFHETLMHGMLGFLLFAGALHVNLGDLLENRGPIFGLASVGVLISTVLIGFGSYAVFRAVGLELPWIDCLLFGALLSPTDPIAVLGMLKSHDVPKRVQIRVAGESLFNDGVGVVVFSAILAAAGAGHGADEGMGAGRIALLFLREAGGGIALGWAAGYVVYRMMRSVDQANLEVLLSVALVMGLTMAAFQLHTSAPLACVVAGLFIGNHGRRFAMSERTRRTLDLVWEFIDETLNAILFLLVGLEVIEVYHDPWRPEFLLAGGLLIVVSLAARFVSVVVPVSALRSRYEFSRGAVKILTWGGLRGGISLALALSLRTRGIPGYDAILWGTYAVVIFSVVVQGLTIGRVIEKTLSPAP